MSRSLLALLVVIVLLVGGLVFFASRGTQQEPVHMEKVVPLDNLTN